MSKKFLLAVSAALLTAGAAFAGGQNDAGCGVGSLLFKDNTPGQQILAATTNGTFGNQTFGITSGTAGCGSGGVFKKASAAREAYFAVNFPSLKKDFAQGSGEYATTFAKLMGCKDAAVPAFLSFAKTQYQTVVPSAQTSSNEALRNLEAAVAANPSLAKACTL